MSNKNESPYLSREDSIKLIKLYGSYRLMWDPRNRDYTNKDAKEDAWNKILKQMGPSCKHLTVKDLKVKFKVLHGSYRGEKSREKKSKTNGNNIYISSWYGYPYFDFLKDRYDPGDTQESSQSLHLDNSHENNHQSLVDAEEAPNFEEKIDISQPVVFDEFINNENSIKTPQQSRKKIKIENDSNDEDNEIVSTPNVFKQSETLAMDSYEAYGYYIAHELRKYDPITLAHVKRAISNIIFEADIGKYNTISQPSDPGSSETTCIEPRSSFI